MIVATAEIELYLYEVYSLKDKRSIVKSVIERVRTKFHVSIAEVNYLDSWQRAGIGIACVSNERKQAEKQLEHIIRFIEQSDGFEVSQIFREVM
jgi:uncharacterized protein YlxP (DUF503 family)